MDDVMKIVNFFKYCVDCEHKDKKEDEDPCFECLENPVNINSEKPVKWEAKS